MAGLSSRQHRSLSQIKEAITKIFALTEVGSVRAVMPGACGTIAQPNKNISQDPLLKGLNCCRGRDRKNRCRPGAILWHQLLFDDIGCVGRVNYLLLLPAITTEYQPCRIKVKKLVPHFLFR